MPDMSDNLMQDLLFEAASGGDPLEAEMPTGRSIRRTLKLRQLRLLQQEHLQEAMPTAPAPGESVHIISNGRYDFATWIPTIIKWFGRADFLYCSTWTLSRANAQEIFAIHDAGEITRGQLHFLTGLYFKRREAAVYNMLLAGLLERGGRFRAFENYAKILLVANAEAGAFVTVEGSANLNANPRFEQYVITNDRALLDFHRAWMDEVFTSTPRQYRSTTSRAEGAKCVGYSHRRAGLGVTAATNDPASRRRIIGAKSAVLFDDATVDAFADDVAGLIRHWLPTPPAGAVITTPPQGASWPGDYFADALARRVAMKARLPFRPLLRRTDEKTEHGPMVALKQTAFVCDPNTPPVAIVVDDLITSGTTMKLSLEALTRAGAAVYGFAWNGA